jgi:hypothetical protein
MSIRTAERLIRAELRKRFGPRYRDSFEIRTCASNRAISVHWRGAPAPAVRWLRRSISSWGNER